MAGPDSTDILTRKQVEPGIPLLEETHKDFEQLPLPIIQADPESLGRRRKTRGQILNSPHLLRISRLNGYRLSHASSPQYRQHADRIVR